jgi:AcrR family transcriptional regulator
MRDSGKERDLLRCGLEIVSDRGLAGLSLGGLAERAEMSKSGLFAHFRSKTELQIKLLDFAGDALRREVIDPAMGTAPGLPRLRTLFDRWLNWPTHAGLPGGCPWAAAAFELDDTDGPVRDHVAASLARWTALLTVLVEDAIGHGHLRADLDVEQFVWQLHGLYLGHHVAQRLLREANADRRARAMFDGLVAASLEPARRAPTRRPSRTPGQQR